MYIHAHHHAPSQTMATYHPQLPIDHTINMKKRFSTQKVIRSIGIGELLHLLDTERCVCNCIQTEVKCRRLPFNVIVYIYI